MKFKFNAMVGPVLAATSFGSAAVSGGSQKMAEAVLKEVPSQSSWLTEHPWVLATLATLPGIAILGVFLWLRHNKKLGNAGNKEHAELLKERHREYHSQKPILAAEELEAATQQFSVELGKRIENLLISVGITSHALAQTAGMSKWDMEQVLKGKRPLTTTECFVIANTLGLTVHQLMSDLESDK
ncbi:helix-turn-helix transcriptional regulator [Vibrio parahaemolyticus]|uniref:helix-turn-helix domain-containing protein n=1 Tax=Vibrio parahaemolyticus TaxID=670 RepID=UPI0023EDB28A|nr:helix-turn-helix transcriptional regulator [Vibrio parahaemolyticus]